MAKTKDTPTTDCPVDEVKHYPQTWLDVWNSNYNEQSKEAKALQNFTKANYKGNNYIPWATMERIMYQQDPNSFYEKILDPYGGLVHIQEYFKVQNTETTKDGVVTGSSSKAKVLIMFVKVRVVFMGKEFIEDYPIQDNSYNPVNVLDQNIVNKSLQRAFAKCASRATGIGFKLYEGKDLQYDEETSKTTTVVETVVPASVATVTVEKVTTDLLDTASVPVEVDPILLEVATLLKNYPDREKLAGVVKILNGSLISSFSISIDPEKDSFEDLCSKLSVIKKIDTTLAFLNKKLGLGD